MILLLLAFRNGETVSQRAFNECIDDGEEVREALSSFYRDKGSYPRTLSELGLDLPGDRLLLPNILRYDSNGSSYTLVFADWLVSHQASDQQPFVATK